MRRYPFTAFSLYREALKIHCELAYAKIPIHCISLYREALKILVAGLCEDTHPPASLYIGKP